MGYTTIGSKIFNLIIFSDSQMILQSDNLFVIHINLKYIYAISLV